MRSPDYVNTDVWDIVDCVEKEINDLLNIAKHIKDSDVIEFVATHYSKIVDTVVYQMSCLPVDRVSKGLEPLQRHNEVNEPFNEIIHMLSVVFGKPADEISKDMMERTEMWVADDLRTARRLRTDNMLH